MPVKNATELIQLMENTLGCAPDINDERPIWKWRAVEAGKINKKVRTNATLYSWANLELAVAYLWGKRQALKTPYGIFYAVEDALTAAAEPEVARPIGELVDEAIRLEREQERPGWQDWCSRLSRAFGQYRAEVYQEWVTERRS